MTATRQNVILYGLVALLAALYLYPFVEVFSDAPDYGVFLNGADLLNHGSVPSRDFVEPQGPGSFVWLALFFRLFGTSLATARGLLSATGIGMALLAVFLSRRLGATGLGAGLFVLTVSIPLMPINSPHYDTNLFALGSLAIFLLAWDKILKFEKPASWAIALPAVLCGVMTWMIQQKGFYCLVAILLAIVLFLRKQAIRSAVLVSATYCITVLVPFGVLFARHALPDVIYANYIWPLAKYSELNAAPYGFPVWDQLWLSLSNHAGLPIAQFEDVATTVPYALIAVLPLLLPLAARLCGRTWFSFSVLPHWLFAYALWLSELHRLDMGHLRNGSLVLGVLFFSVCEARANSALRRIGFVSTAFVVLAGTTNLMGSLSTGEQVETRRGKIHPLIDTRLIRFLENHTRPGEELFIYPYQPIYYFLENLKNPTRYSYLQYHLHTDAQFLEATRDLERKKVRYVVFDTVLSGDHFAQVFPAYTQPPKDKLIMEPYLESHYHLAEDLGRFQILERTSGPR